MKRIILLAGVLSAFILGIMLFLYIADPGSVTTTEPLPSAPLVSAKNAILIDGKTGETLYEKEADTKAYPASTTKIMTALTVLAARQVPAWMRVDPAIRDITAKYFMILYLPMLFRSASVIFSTVLRALGDSRTPMRVGIIVNLTLYRFDSRRRSGTHQTH